MYKVPRTLILTIVVIILLTSCSHLDGDKAVQVLTAAKSYYAEYSYQSIEGTTVSIKEWYQEPSKLHQQISYDGYLIQQVWVREGKTTISHVQLDDDFVIEKEVNSQLLTLYQQLSKDDTHFRKEDNHYVITGETAEGVAVTIKCDAKGLPIEIQLYSNKVRRKLKINKLELDCHIKESLFQKGTE